ncbi:MAG: SUMF1/EgtB/PvdO family nonheme iron enzyme [Candidatus Poribacteria bacterium]|nr:SUMF1/EgtB/PvdO family nonheme iron enzyme [Candidatus Poribacteria bacterium]
MGAIAGGRLSKGNKNVAQRHVTLSNFYCCDKLSDTVLSSNLEVQQPFSSPVVGVIWRNTVAICDWISAETDLSFRLPTETE